MRVAGLPWSTLAISQEPQVDQGLWSSRIPRTSSSAGTQLRGAGMAVARCRFCLAKGAVLARVGVTGEGCPRLSPDLGCADSVP
jgi:hypothetical protein